MITDFIAVTASCAALGLSIYTYFSHDKRLNEQNKIINDFQLKKYNKEADSEKRADIEANVIDQGTGHKLIKVYNKGKALAKNVEVAFIGEPDIIIFQKPPIMDLKPYQSIELSIQTHKDSPEILQLTFKWKDEAQPINESMQTIQI